MRKSATALILFTSSLVAKWLENTSTYTMDWSRSHRGRFNSGGA
jgi:hypothetical protein